MGGQEIPMVSSNKYLGCVIDEHLTLKDMVEDRAAAGKKALGSWLGRYAEEKSVMLVLVLSKSC